MFSTTREDPLTGGDPVDVPAPGKGPHGGRGDNDPVPGGFMERFMEDFEAIHSAYRPRIQRYLARLVGPDEAQDLTQEVFARVGRGLSGFEGAAKLSTWIYRIATNVATDRLRSRSFREARSGKADLSREGSPEDVDSLPDEKCASLERQAMRREMSSCIHDYIGALPRNYRAIVVLSDIEGLTNREIAEVLGMTEGVIKIRLHRGRAVLREKLEAGCRFERDEEDVLVCDPKTDPDRDGQES